MVVSSVFAQKKGEGTEQQLAKEAQGFFEAGDFLQAYPLYSQLVSLYPSNTDYTYKFGACAIYSDADKSKAIRFLSSATRKEVADPMAWYYLGKAYHLNYQFKDAVTAFEAFKSKDAKLAEEMGTQREIETCIYGSTLLSNIKDLVVIDKKEADRANFFRYMDLNGIGGKILAVPDELKSAVDKKKNETSVIHYPGNATTIYFSSYGKDENTGKDIYKTQILPDGKFTTPEKLRGDVNTKYDEDFCFMHSDGKTLYFSSRGHNSMGGYDIFKSVMDPATGVFGPAINLDFAINTPDDDIFFIADSLNKNAYFASSRASDQGHMHVYNVRVEGIPLQIVYLKGEFLSEVDAEQKKATIDIKDPLTGRSVCKSTSDMANGNVLLYVPKAGSYTYTVSTENSPNKHEVEVKIPSFDRPVAVRQEIILKKENGQERVEIINHFETPLEEDIAALAAEMLRQKAGLEVNSDSNAADATSETSTTPALSVEKTMANAPLAAGFGEGVTITTIVDSMNADLQKSKAFMKASDEKINTSMVYAAKKQKEADAILKKAEDLREATSNNNTPDDINKIRESVKLTAQAELLQREAKSAIASANSLKEEQAAEQAKVTELEADLLQLIEAEKSQNFDGAYAALTKEKNRQVALRMSPKSTYEMLVEKAKAIEKQQRTVEESILNNREEEKSIEKEVAAAERAVAEARKKSDRAEAESRLANVRSDLDAVRRAVVRDSERANQIGLDAKNAYRHAEFFKSVNENPTLGLKPEELQKMDAMQAETLADRIDALSTRLEALEIKDPLMLAQITDATMESLNVVASERPIQTNTTPTVKYENASSIPSRGATEIASRKDAAMASLITANTQSFAPQRMVLENSIISLNEQIRTLEKRQETGLAEDEKVEMARLIDMRGALQAELAQEPSVTLTADPTVLNEVYNQANPAYTASVEQINSKSVNDVARVFELNSLKKATLQQLKNERKLNAENAINENTAEALSSAAEKDQQLSAAIRTLEKETNDVTTLRGAYESSIKEVIEGEKTASDKLEEQTMITQSYLTELNKMEAQLRAEMKESTDQKTIFRSTETLTALLKEKEQANIRLSSYTSDRELTTNTSQPEANTSGAKTTNEVVAENTSASPAATSEASSEKETILSQVSKDGETVQTLFESKEEVESIFAYENGGLKELMEKHPTIGNNVRDFDKITAIQSEIYQVEGAIAIESSEAKQKKLDRQAEELYGRKAYLELGNVNTIQELTAAEYATQLAQTNAAKDEKKNIMEERMILRDEVNKLVQQAAAEMEEAAGLRQKATPVADEIEKNDFYRQAFAKEVHAIELLKQSQALLGNTELIAEYNDDELNSLRFGYTDKVAEARINQVLGASDNAPAAVVETPGAEAAQPAMNEKVETSSSATTVTESTTPTSNGFVPYLTEDGTAEVIFVSNNKTLPSKSTTTPTPTTTPANTPASTVAAPATNVDVQPEPIIKGVNDQDVAVVNIPVEKSAVSQPISLGAIDVQPEPIIKGVNDQPVASLPSTPSGAAFGSEDFVYTFPEVLITDIFKPTKAAAYTDSRPIPIDPEMPKGIYYKVQIGAFRSRIPQNLFDEFAPVCGETVGNGLVRYSAGFFMTYDRADQIKMDIRRMGYADAFVVAYKDGKRIPIFEAMAATESDYAASYNKEVSDLVESGPMRNNLEPTTPVNKVNTTSASPVTTTSTTQTTVSADGTKTVTTVTTTETVSNPANKATAGDYYKGVPDAAPAVQVETTKGLFYTVQVGVYSKPTPASKLANIAPLNSELTATNKIRYTAGRFTSLQDAVNKRAEARQKGIDDAFITAYYNGVKITMSEADRILKEFGSAILYQEQ